MTTKLRVAPKQGDNKVEEETVSEIPRRLVVELNRKTASDLAWLVEEEETNKTTLVNRAVQVYKRIMEAQSNGGSITINDPERGAPERLLIV